MKTKLVLPLAKRLAVVAVSLTVLIGLVSLLPGKVEGHYRDVGVRCMCDCVNFLQFRDGKIIHYASDHPPANIIGRYTIDSGGKVTMYYSSYADDVPEEIIGYAYPHFLVTRFSWIEDDSSEWGFKRPRILTIKETIKKQDITTAYINADRSVTTTFYDSFLQPSHEEIRLPENTNNKQNKSEEPTPNPPPD